MTTEAGSPARTLDVTAERSAAGGRQALVAGVDEVGRGALAGPVVAAAVALPWWDERALRRLAIVADSKRMSPRDRCIAFAVIRDVAVSAGVGRAAAHEVDALGIGRATVVAMRRAIRAMRVPPEQLLVDGLPVDLGGIATRSIVKGDASVLSIAAASVLAKVVRDADVVALSLRAPCYRLHEHKGYGAPAHLRALYSRGVTPEHRLTWRPVREAHVAQPNAAQCAGVELAWHGSARERGARHA